MMTEVGGKPGDERGFFHKKILGVVGKVAGILPIPGAGIIGTVARTLAGGGTPSGRTVPRTLTARPTEFSAAEKERGRAVKFAERPFGGGAGPCRPGTVPDPQGRGFCIAPTSPLGAQELVGEAIMGRYGAALVPGSRIIDRAVCLPGMQLGDDGLCYNKSQITNKQRMWPAGRKPLLSGGDMRAISIAARAGRRLEGATKRLQRMGMMKKPASRRALPRGRGMTIKEAGAGSVTVQ